MESNTNRFSVARQFENLGREAFSLGIRRATALDTEFLLNYARVKDSIEIMDAMNAWYAGWDAENIAAPIPGWTDAENAALVAARGT